MLARDLLPAFCLNLGSPDAFVEARVNMSLQGSITELQNAVLQLYHKLQQRFKENRMMNELWSAMAHDISNQISSLHALPLSFWNHLKDDFDGLNHAIASCGRSQIADKDFDDSLRNCFERSLRIEEPIILKAYVPIIRSLRENQANQSLEFYIMVKAHLARITRIIQAFAGDPLIIQRSNLLLQDFEKDVQEHQKPSSRKAGHAVRPRVSKSHAGKKEAKPHRSAAKRITYPLAKRSLSRAGRTKPLIDKVEIRRRRARR